MSSSLEDGRYKAVFLDYLEKAEKFCEAQEMLERVHHFIDMQFVYGDKLVTVMEYRDEFISLCDELRSNFGLYDDFDEAIGRVEARYEATREDEAISYGRLKRSLKEHFGISDKVVQIKGEHGLRKLLTEENHARERRDCFRRLLLDEGEPMTPQEMLTYFKDEVFDSYKFAGVAELS